MDQITIDISGLEEMGDTIYVASLDLGEGVQILNDDDEMLAKIVQPSAARALERLEAAEAAEAEGELAEGEEAEGEGEETEDEEDFE
jgi:large subunit ribosomal protein L25